VEFAVEWAPASQDGCIFKGGLPADKRPHLTPRRDVAGFPTPGIWMNNAQGSYISPLVVVVACMQILESGAKNSIFHITILPGAASKTYSNIVGEKMDVPPGRKKIANFLKPGS